MVTDIIAINDQTDLIDINSVEGIPMSGVSIKPLLEGEKGLLIEVHVRKGTITPRHVHDHESLCYVKSGKIRVVIGQKTSELGPGDAFLHPVGLHHVSEALEDSIWIEVKSPPEKTW